MYLIQSILILILAAFISSLESSNRLLVISFDGFRYDYIDRHITPNIHKLKVKSTSAKFLLNVFPTQTFPNHFSIATGLYSENHGVLASEVFDIQTKSLLKYGYELWHYNESVIPIWTLNEKAKGHSGVIMWPGSNFEYAGINASYSEKYNLSVTWESRVKTMINWFTNESKPANLVMMYFEEPDKDSHAYGPDSPQTNIQIKRVDKITKYILDQLRSEGLLDVNVIILSDHGMEGVTIDHIIDLKPIVGNISNMYGTSPVLQVYPLPGKDQEVYSKLKVYAAQNGHFNVYKQNEIPDRFHYKLCSRAPPIMVLAEPKYAFQDLYDGIDWYKKHYSDVTNNNTFGVHGYDPLTVQMHPYFIASGPLFRENFEADHLYTVDMYLLFAKILNLKPIFADGNVERVLQVLNSSAKPGFSVSIGLVIFGLTISVFYPIFYFLRKYRKLRSLQETILLDDVESVALLET